MQQFLIGLVIMAVLCGCRKETSRRWSDTGPGDINMTCGQMQLSEASANPNETDHYQFGGNAGNYFGLIATFPVESGGNLQLRFGNILTGDYFITEDDISVLFSTGKKELGSLGAFSSYATVVQGAAEIAYTDQDGVRWCSTLLKEHYDDGRLQTTAELVEDAGFIQIDSTFLHQSTQGLNPSCRVNGEVNTTLFEVNGDRQQILSGSFSALVGMD